MIFISKDSINLLYYLLVLLIKLEKLHFCTNAIYTRKLLQKRGYITLRRLCNNIVFLVYAKVIYFPHTNIGFEYAQLVFHVTRFVFKNLENY